MDDINEEDFESWALRPNVSPRVHRSYNETKGNVNILPFGLTNHVTLEEYRANPVCTLSAYKYKVYAKVCMTSLDQKYVLSVLDTGAGPNFIR